MPFLFAGSGAQAAGGVAMIFVGTDQTAPARRMALAGAAGGRVAVERITKKGLVAEPYREGRPGTLMKAARNATIAASALNLAAGGRSRLLSAVAGLTYIGASIATRFGVFEAGLASARDPKYVVVPQRERLAAKQATRQAEEDRGVPPSAGRHVAGR
jgi:hypothetical protein